MSQEKHLLLILLLQGTHGPAVMNLTIVCHRRLSERLNTNYQWRGREKNSGGDIEAGSNLKKRNRRMIQNGQARERSMMDK